MLHSLDDILCIWWTQVQEHRYILMCRGKNLHCLSWKSRQFVMNKLSTIDHWVQCRLGRNSGKVRRLLGRGYNKSEGHTRSLIDLALRSKILPRHTLRIYQVHWPAQLQTVAGNWKHKCLGTRTNCWCSLDPKLR